MDRSTIADILQEIIKAGAAVVNAQTDIEKLKSKITGIQAERARDPDMPGLEDDLWIYTGLLQNAVPTSQAAEATFRAAQNTLQLAQNRYAQLQAVIEKMKSPGEWQRRGKADAARRTRQQQQRMQEESNKSPQLFHTFCPQAPVEVTETIQQWRQEIKGAFADYTTMQTFPQPPVQACNNISCQATRRSLQACSCNIRAAFMGTPDLSLKKERLAWHPDHFSACSEQYHVAFKQMAMEIFVVVDAMYNEQK
ncbi:hypothetical protein M409DRAFT_54353 [Zasmidium cellare ATCC 36951]|uniref:Uncharacterized protein n=1 Tax=Zasmidium cellare ATCC 36951 TaxID=1080233 RepID=A0A6A6CLS2_ZASCE|nr:uncharacterized protein M409DRAFT_54353 [Zasmidium cellare ATCC 36951]KAF2167158.1 hypothetical protein M409DRAFT_54353 [Zasmidium cellare ATCC 36951]